MGTAQPVPFLQGLQQWPQPPLTPAGMLHLCFAAWTAVPAKLLMVQVDSGLLTEVVKKFWLWKLL